MKTPLVFVVFLFLIAVNHATPYEIVDNAAEKETLINRHSFPKGFVFGTATAAFQVEGMARGDGRGPSIWDVYVQTPGNIVDNSTAEVSTDQYHNYKIDVNILARMNFDAYRFSISWSRIFPNGRGKVNWKGVAYYNRLINYVLKRGITPYVTLYHWDFPQALEKEYDGFLSHKVVEDFTNYADFCFKMFGDRVKHWMTFNEPRVTASHGYDDGDFAPGRCSNCKVGNSGTEPYIVTHNIILSHASAVQRYREKYQKKQGGKIGIVLEIMWYEPLTRSIVDQYAAQRARDFHVGWYMHPIVYGEYPKTIQENVGERLPKFTEEDVKIVKGSIDFLGVNHYTTNYAYDLRPSKPEHLSYRRDWNVGTTTEKNGVPIGPSPYTKRHPIVPWGIRKTLMYIKKTYEDPTIIITENGMDYPGNATLPQELYDTKRISFYKSYMEEVKKAIEQGANVKGYFAWSLLDNFEWTMGYTSRYGIVYVDYNTLKRYPKMSAYWFKKILRRN